MKLPMNNQAAILRDLRESIDDALRRTEERMSHVQRQLAGWSLPIARSAPVPDPTSSWDTNTPSKQMIDAYDQDLASAQSSLSELVHYGRQVKSTINK